MSEKVTDHRSSQPSQAAEAVGTFMPGQKIVSFLESTHTAFLIIDGYALLYTLSSQGEPMTKSINELRAGDIVNPELLIHEDVLEIESAYEVVAKTHVRVIPLTFRDLWGQETPQHKRLENIEHTIHALAPLWASCTNERVSRQEEMESYNEAFEKLRAELDRTTQRAQDLENEKDDLERQLHQLHGFNQGLTKEKVNAVLLEAYRKERKKNLALRRDVFKRTMEAQGALKSVELLTEYIEELGELQDLSVLCVTNASAFQSELHRFFMTLAQMPENPTLTQLGFQGITVLFDQFGLKDHKDPFSST